MSNSIFGKPYLFICSSDT